MHMSRPAIFLIALVLGFSLFTGGTAQSNTFNYQGSLNTGGTPASGGFDFEFVMYDALNGGNQIGPVLSRNSVAVTNGVFAVQLDFGTVFSGANRFMEIRVRPAGQPGITILAPRQPVDSTPYAIRSLNSDVATTASNAQSLGGVSSNQFVVTTDPRMTNARTPTPGSGDYIQNSGGVQAASFNISGSGTAGGTLSGNILRATTQYNIGGSRLLSVPDTGDLFAGVGAGTSNTTGTHNSFFGITTGFANTSGSNNSFFGSAAGDSNMTGDRNSFFGRSAGSSNTTASDNSFFGANAGDSNLTGASNSFFGRNAGESNTTGFGNSIIGTYAGTSNTTGFSNLFVGTFAGNTNTTGSNNTTIGNNADVSSGDLIFATAIGAGAVVSGNNNIVLGRDAGEDQVSIPGGLRVNGDEIRVDGMLHVETLDSASATHVCINGFDHLSTCSSSLRYKEFIVGFVPGLQLVKRLRPVAFDWKTNHVRDLGLIAEEVAVVEPLLVTHNKTGVIEGVKYDQVSVVLINAVNEQQTQIESQQAQLAEQIETIRRQRVEIGELRAHVCAQTPSAAFCRPKE